MKTLRRTPLLLPLALAVLAGCMDRDLPTALAPGRAMLTQSAAGPVVNSLADPGDGVCADAGTGDGCTLREAIAFAEPGATITFDANLTQNGPATITLSGSRLEIPKNLTINGPGAHLLAVSGNNASGVLHIGQPIGQAATLVTLVTLSGLTITGGSESGVGGGIRVQYGQHSLTLMNCTVSGNRVTGYGGGILHESSGTLSLVNSTVSRNSAAFGGGIFQLRGTVTLIYSTVTDNDADEDGGGIFSYMRLTLTNSTVSRNTAGTRGGGIFVENGTVTLTNSTVSGNRAFQGGGFDVEGARLSLTNSTVSGNIAAFGGAIYGSYADAVALTHSTVADNTATSDKPFAASGINGVVWILTLRGSLIARNSGGPDIGLDYVNTLTASHSLIGSAEGGHGIQNGVDGNIVGVSDADLKLGELADNGGPTLTHALLAGSPAINAGDPDFSDPNLLYDQRGSGLPRVQHGRIDIGAFEFVCLAGQVYASGACVPAPAGHYAGLGDASATACPLGSYQGATGQTSCLLAPIGSYVDVTGATAATPCPAATTTQAVGSTSIAACVSTGGFSFSGFFAPVDNLPTVNVAKAGSAIPVKFSLGSNHGLENIFASGSPSSQKVDCDNSAPQDAVSETVSAGTSSLSYDAASDRYTYIWKTDKSWGGTCRTLILTFTDGTEHTASFKFTK